VTSSVDDAGLRVRPVTMAGELLLAVVAPLAPLFPEGGLRRGSTVVVRSDGAAAGAGATSLALAVGAAASQSGSWCAAVGWPALGLVAAAGLGVALERLALVPRPGDQWASVTAALVEAVDVILLRPPRGVRSSDARRLTARVRERGVVLVVCPGAGGGRAWPDVVDLTLLVSAASPWRGLGQGHGYLQARSVEVASSGRGAASRERRVRLWLPGADGAVTPARVGGELDELERESGSAVGSVAAAAG
jgi:hypothetical protein